MDRTILHCDLNSFYASVELISHPELRDQPVAVGGNPKSRHGIILAKNDIAKSFGVQTAETIWQARSKCPSLVILPPNHDKYIHYSRLMNAIYNRFTDQVEPYGIDESWLDVTGSKLLFGDGETIANMLREEAKKEGLTLSIGVSFNKVFAKLGSDLRKPDATTLISKENFKDLIYPLPVKDLLYVGKATFSKLDDMGIETIGQLAMMEKSWLVTHFGKHGEQLYEYANGLDEAPVKRISDREPMKSLGHGLTFKRDIQSEKDIKTAIMSLAERISFRLKNNFVFGRGISVSYKNTKLKSFDHQRVLDTPIQDSMDIFSTAISLLSEFWNGNTEIRAISISIFNLEEGDQPIALLDNLDPRQKALENSIYSVKSRFGKRVISHGSILNNDLGV